MKPQLYLITLINSQTLELHSMNISLDRLQFRCLCLWLRGKSTLSLPEILPGQAEEQNFFQNSRFL
jgi:hypothetical protein